MYIHFNGTCLKKYDIEKFQAQDEDFSERESTFLQNLGLPF